MVARVLSINCGYNSNLSEISEKLRNGYCDVVVAKTQEDAIKISEPI